MFSWGQASQKRTLFGVHFGTHFGSKMSQSPSWERPWRGPKKRTIFGPHFEHFWDSTFWPFWDPFGVKFEAPTYKCSQASILGATGPIFGTHLASILTSFWLNEGLIFDPARLATGLQRTAAFTFAYVCIRVQTLHTLHTCPYVCINMRVYESVNMCLQLCIRCAYVSTLCICVHKKWHMSLRIMQKN